MRKEVAHRLAANAIFIGGVPRSGTTWLAKIIDSHPNILYRHEPDVVSSLRTELSIENQIAEWIARNDVRVATKAPVFPKAWMKFPPLHNLLAISLNGQNRLVGNHTWLPTALPDRAATQHPATRVALKLVGWDGSCAAKALPASRSLFIIRHPCGQIFSTLQGVVTRQFQTALAPNTLAWIKDLAFTRNGIPAAEFDQLPMVAKLAWYWLIFNEAVISRLLPLANAKIIIYEQLCHLPKEIAGELFAFSGLNWSQQTEAFINASTNYNGNSKYYGVLRNSPTQTAENWRIHMRSEDETAVRAVIAKSWLMRYWSE